MRAPGKILLLLVSGFVSTGLAALGAICTRTQEASASLLTTLNGASLPFVENIGQVQSPDVRYCASTFGGLVFVTRDGQIIHTLLKKAEPDRTRQRCTLREFFPGSAGPAVRGADRVETRVSFLKGRDPKEWKQGVAAFAAVDLGELYPGIALSLKAYGKNVEKLFHIDPGADPAAIRCRLAGARAIRVSEEGRLEVATDLGTVEFTRPVAYQDVNGLRTGVEAGYVVKDTEYGFRLGPYDRTKPLVIDPLMASTFLGGSDDESIEGMALDRDGNVFVVGSTASWDFPATAGTVFPSSIGDRDVFISKFGPDLANLLASTYLGGNGFDEGLAIAVDDAGRPYITGDTDSPDFPLTQGAWDKFLGPEGGQEAFVVKLDAALTNILASTYLGGADWEEGRAVRVNTNGDVYVAGKTWSVSFPTTPGAYDTSYNGFGAWMNYGLAARVKLMQGSVTLLVCNSDQGQYQVTIRDDDTIDIVRWNNETGQWTDLAWIFGVGVAVGEWQSVEVSAKDGFIEVRLDGAQVLTANDTEMPMLIGGRCAISAMVSDFEGMRTSEVYVDDVAVTNEHGTIWADNFDDGNVDEWWLSDWGSVGPSGWNLIEEAGNFSLHSLTVLTGQGGGGSWAEPSEPMLESDVFLSKLSPDLTQLLASTFLGGTGEDQPTALRLGHSGQVYVCGDTSSSDFPAATNAFDRTLDGDWVDCFVAELDADLAHLLGATFLGGNDEDAATAMDLDSGGHVYVGGWTWSQDFPTTTNAYTRTFSQGHVGFVSKFNEHLTGLVSSTLLGAGGERISALAVSSNGAVYAAGSSWNALPTTSEAYDQTPNGGLDAFVSSLSEDLRNLLASTFLGGSGDDEAHAIGLGHTGDVYVAGMTESWDFPTANAYEATPRGGRDGFVSRLDAELSRPPQPLIQVRPPSWNFGYVPIGAAATQVFEVVNLGRLPLQIGALVLAGGPDVPHFSIANDQCSGHTVAPLGLQTCRVSVVFAPTNLWGKAAVLRIPSDDWETPTMDVPLYGTGRSTNAAEGLFLEGMGRLSAYNHAPHDTNDLLMAQQKFAGALAADPNHYGADLYLLITRLLSLVYDPDVAKMLTDFGVSETGRDLWNWTAQSQKPLPATAPALDEAIGFAALKMGAIIDEGLTFLGRIPTNWTGSIVLSPNELPIDNEVEVDAGDIQIFQCGLSTLQGVFHILLAHNTHLKFQDFDSKPAASAYLAAHPSLGTITNAMAFAAATNSFIRAIDFYLAGASLIRGETDYQTDDLIIFDPSDARDEQRTCALLGQIRNALTGSKSSPFRVELSQFLDLGYAFSHPFSLRDLLTGDGIQSVLAGPFLHQVDRALVNLSGADSSFNQILDPSNYPVAFNTEVDYGDISLAKAWLSGLKSVSCVAAAYNGVVDLVALGETKPLQAANVFAGHPQLLLATNAPALVTASNALRDAIDFYLAGSAFIRAETDDQTDDLTVIGNNTLFVGNDATLHNESSFRSLVQSLRDSLSGPVMIDHVNDRGMHDFHETMHLERFFVPAYVSRAHLPQFDWQNKAIAGTFPDPTFNGVFPGMTQWHLAELLALYLPDADTNGLPDLWEQEYFGATGIDPHADPDQDGADNYEEYVAGTRPRSGDSRFKLATTELKPDRTVIRWASEPYRMYSIEKSTNLLLGFWTIESFVPATPFENVYTDSAPPLKQQFYRVRVVP